MRASSRAFAVWALGLAALTGCAAGSRPPEHPPDTRVILTLGDEEAVWRFIPIDVLPGAAEVVLDLPPPPPGIGDSPIR